MKLIALGKKEFLDCMKAGGVPTAQSTAEKAAYILDESPWKEKQKELKEKYVSVIQWRE